MYLISYCIHVTNCRIELSSFNYQIYQFSLRVSTKYSSIFKVTFYVYYYIQTFTKSYERIDNFIISTIQTIKFIGSSSMFNAIPSYPSYPSFVGTHSYVLQFPLLIVRPTGLDILSCRCRLLANSSIDVIRDCLYGQYQFRIFSGTCPILSRSRQQEVSD